MDKKAHASHNEDACNFLHKDGNYCDWVVTTAFYFGLKSQPLRKSVSEANIAKAIETIG